MTAGRTNHTKFASGMTPGDAAEIHDFRQLLLGNLIWDDTEKRYKDFDPEYVQALKNYDPVKQREWLEGSWDILKKDGEPKPPVNPDPSLSPGPRNHDQKSPR